MARQRLKKSLISLTFGNALKAAREKKGLKHERLAENLEMSPAVISYYESGMRVPTKTTFEMLCKEVEGGSVLREAWEKARVEWQEYLKKNQQANSKFSRIVERIPRDFQILPTISQREVLDNLVKIYNESLAERPLALDLEDAVPGENEGKKRRRRR